MGRDEISVTEAEFEHARDRSARMYFLLSFVGVVGLTAVVIPSVALAMHYSHGAAVPFVSALFNIIVGFPLTIVAIGQTRKQTAAGEAAMDHLRAELTEALEHAEGMATRREVQAKQQEFESQLTNALEMAADEAEVIDVVERAFEASVGGADAELLLADNSHAHLTRMAASSSATGSAMCTVESPDQCPAARRAQVQRFPDSDALDACPKLRDREGGRCSAVCVPVSIMGRTVGVIHVTGRPDVLPSDGSVKFLSTLANQSGARVGLLRMMADTQMQASTDSLTGLLNRRAFENSVRKIRNEHSTFAVAMADLDHFKHLNDTFGHDTGDRALRLFSQTLRGVVRSHDIVARYGGEEFALVLPSCSAIDASTILDRVRASLAQATTEAGLPTVTVSFGVVDAESGEDLTRSLARADAALLEAKRGGRDRVVRHTNVAELRPVAENAPIATA
jgi:diguanylate cyclase (GGDEF)-like protein